MWNLDNLFDNSWYNNNFLDNLLNLNNFWYFNHLLNDFINVNSNLFDSFNGSWYFNDLFNNDLDWVVLSDVVVNWLLDLDDLVDFYDLVN